MPALVAFRAAARDATRKDRLGKKLYVGNIPFTTTEAELRELFGRHGTIERVSVITDRETGRPRGFAFVEMDARGADDAMRALDGSQLGGRSLRVSEAQERGDRGPRGGGGMGGPRRDRYSATTERRGGARP